MAKLINIGYGNAVNSDKIVSVISPDSAPIKRLIQSAKEKGTSVDATQGRRTRAIIITDSGHVILSALMPETIAERIEGKNTNQINKEKADENNDR